ncbi:hypothetical protein HEP87_60175 [Streptomyces sp. S1D4-11]
MAAALACAVGYTAFTVWIMLSRTTRRSLGARPGMDAVPVQGGASARDTVDG